MGPRGNGGAGFASRQVGPNFAADAQGRRRVAGNWNGQWNGNWHRRHHRHRFGFGPGFVAGIGLGYADYYDYPYAYAYDDAYDDYVGDAYAGPTEDGSAIAYCRQRYRSYDIRTQTYLGFDGQRHPCP
ncbi:MAG TPA: BA14K family protein [Pseudorhodoplanes sp.]|nr:BA14K family protein [Pseudorhodoplanes sp.]